jgi:hypothetical protein
MKSYFDQEEQYLSNEFYKKNENGSRLLNNLLRLIEELIKSSGFKNDQYPEYSIILRGLHALMALSNSVALLSKGYMGDAQAVHKRAVEFILRAMYFKEFPEEEKKWRENKGKLPTRQSMADLLDSKHKQHKIFPTDYDTLWRGFVYGTMYKSVNDWAHGEFNNMYREVAIDDGTNYYTHRFFIGPRPDEGFVKIMLNALIHSCRIQILILVLTFNSPKEKYHDLMIESEQYLLNQQTSQTKTEVNNGR